MSTQNTKTLGLFTLIALVIGNMLGAGVFTTSGFALGELGSPLYVLLAWFIGGLLALCGAISYGALVRLMPVSGGEYYFLSRVVHPMAGFVAGWISLWAGFTAAIALAAITFEAYLLPSGLRETLPDNSLATVVILLAALAHGFQVRHGARLQTATVTLKLLLITGFILFVTLTSDIDQWPGVQAWRQSPGVDFSLPVFAVTLMWISYSYSGFNAAIYVASEVGDAARKVPRAMIQATLLTTGAYLVLNGIFVFAPAPGDIVQQEDVAALASQALAGEALANVMRGVIVIALFTSISAMIMAGPRVYAQMAADGLMPAFLRFEGPVPGIAIAMQALLSIVVVWISGLQQLLSYLGFTLALSTVATIASLFVVAGRNKTGAGRLPGYPWAPGIFITFTLLFAGLAATINPMEMLAAVITIVSAVVIYWLIGRRHQTISR